MRDDFWRDKQTYVRTTWPILALSDKGILSHSLMIEACIVWSGAFLFRGFQLKCFGTIETWLHARTVYPELLFRGFRSTNHTLGKCISFLTDCHNPTKKAFVLKNPAASSAGVRAMRMLKKLILQATIAFFRGGGRGRWRV